VIHCRRFLNSSLIKDLTMPRAKPKLPPIAVEDRSEKISLSLPLDLRHDIARFGEFFAAETGQKPTSFNAVVVGVIAGYLDSHDGFKKWLKANGGTTRCADNGGQA
jgi:hypothetical protein